MLPRGGAVSEQARKRAMAASIAATRARLDADTERRRVVEEFESQLVEVRVRVLPARRRRSQMFLAVRS